MTPILRFMARRRFNYTDLIGMWAFVTLWTDDKLALAAIALGIACFVSVAIENHAEGSR